MALVRLSGRTALLTLYAAAATTCASPTEPLRYPAVVLQELRISDQAVLRDSGVMVLVGLPRDTTRILGLRERLRTELSTSAGDIESFDLNPNVCDDFTLSCNSVSVVMKSGRQVGELFSLLNTVPARVYRVVFQGEGAGIFVFDPERVPGAVRQLESNAAVKSAERDNYAAFPAPRRFGTYGGLPLDFRQVVVHDGVLQGQPGDTVLVRYIQPDSSSLELRFVIPVP